MKNKRSGSEAIAQKKFGHIAILGAPNAGKSTLINRLCGGKISIVTPKAQTTRVRARGMCMQGETQMVFIDAPGIFGATKPYERTLVREAWAAAAEADVILVLIDAEKGLDADTQAMIESLKKRERRPPVVLAINKVDAVKKPWLLSLGAACGAQELFSEIFMISALSGDGVLDARKYLAAQMPEGEWQYPEDHFTDTPLRVLAAEFTREKLFMLLRQELPYSLMVETEKWEEKGGAIHIMQAIVVERDGQKKIVIGAKGENLKRIGTSARQEMERLTGKKVFLELFVKVDEKWKNQSQ